MVSDGFQRMGGDVRSLFESKPQNQALENFRAVDQTKPRKIVQGPSEREVHVLAESGSARAAIAHFQEIGALQALSAPFTLPVAPINRGKQTAILAETTKISAQSGLSF